MTKYESAKYLKMMKARIPHECNHCGNSIATGELYYKEKIDMRPPPSLILKEFCEKCGNTMLKTKINT